MSIHYDTKAKKYYVKYRINGKSSTSKRFEKKSDAVKHDAYLKLRYFDRNEKEYYFHEVIDMYVDSEKANVCYGTYQKTNMICNRFKELFQNRLINSIKPVDCHEYVKTINNMNIKKNKDGKTILESYNTNTKNDYLQRLKAIFRFAMDEGIISNNPCGRIKRFKNNSKEELNTRKNLNKIIEPEDFKKFVENVSGYKYKLLFTVLYNTGIRLSECLALTWEDIKDGSINIWKSKTRKTDKGPYEIKETKNKSSRRINKIPKFLFDELLKYKRSEEEVPGFNEKWYVFGGINPLAETTIERKRKEAIKKAGLFYFVTHQLRHSYASILIGNGVDIVTVSKLLGHSSIKTTLEVYSHLLPQNVDKVNSILEKKFSKCSLTI